MAQWRVTDREIVALWNSIWPKIVAIAWLDEIAPFQPPFSYRKCFEQSSTFRQTEVRRIAAVLKQRGLLRLDWTSQIPICLASPDQLGIQMPNYVKQASCLYTLTYPFPSLGDGAPSDDTLGGTTGALTDVDPGMLSEAGPERPHAGRPHDAGAASAETTTVTPKTTPAHPGVEAFEETDRPKPIRIRFSCPDALFGNTFFYINHWGIVLPWPPRPSATNIFVGYMEGGGSLPRAPQNGGPPWLGNTLNPTDSDLFSELTTFPTDCKAEPAKVAVDGLIGTTLLTLFEKWGEVIGAAWAIGGAAEHIRKNLKSYILPEVWTEWPPYLDAVDSTRHAFELEGDSSSMNPLGTKPKMKLTAPVPAPVGVQLPTESDVFRELIVGQATNPMYSNCY